MSPLKCCVAKSATQVFTQRNEDLRGFLAVAVVPSNTVSAQYESGGDRPRLFSLVRQLCREPGRTSQSRLPLRSHLSAVLLLSRSQSTRQTDSLTVCPGPLNQERAVALLKLDALVEFSSSVPLCQ